LQEDRNISKHSKKTINIFKKKLIKKTIIMEFGVPRRREVSQNKEKYENIAVITASPFKGKGTGRILSLNKMAVEVLGLNFENKDAVGKDIEAQVSFSFDKMHGTVSIANTTGLINVSEVRVAKTSRSLSDKKYFDAIKENFGVKPEDEVEFKLIDNEQDFNGFKTFKLEKLLATDVLEATVTEAAAETQAEDVLAVKEDEAPLEYVKEQAVERDAFEAIADSTEELNEEVENNEIDQDNPFLKLDSEL